MNKKISIVGATGVVGRETLNLLLKNQVKPENIIAFSSKRTQINENIISNSIDFNRLKGVDYAIFCATNQISKKFAPQFASMGITVVDNTPTFRQEHDVPLVVPEINFNSIQKSHTIIANPNCIMIGALMAIHPIYKQFGMSKLRISTYNSTSGAGINHMQELISQTRNAFSASKIDSKYFKREIIFNLLPSVGEECEDGFTTEENKIKYEMEKVLGKSFDIAATVVRVPTLIGHGISIGITTEHDTSLEEVKQIIKADPELIYEPDPFNATCADILSEYKTIISRIRVVNNNEVLLWAVSNNIKKGAALNALQIIYKMEGATII